MEQPYIPEMPRRAGLICALSLAIPMAAALSPLIASDAKALYWLVPLVTTFILSYYRGWRGTVLAVALSLTMMTATWLFNEWVGTANPRAPLLFALLAVFATLSLAIGLITERLFHDRRIAMEAAVMDPATGLPNRSTAQALLARSYAAAARGLPLTIVLFDLGLGDKPRKRGAGREGVAALRSFARALEHHTRTMNLSARWSDHQFISILLTGTAAGATIFAQRVLEEFASEHASRGQTIVSAGVAGFAAGMQTEEDLLETARQALRKAQDAGGDRFVLADEEREQTESSGAEPVPAR
jgi:diguanylate cyclase (GGDEF)-like protein